MTSNNQNQRGVIYLLIGLCCLLLYGNSIPNEYSLDDHLVTLNNKLVEKGVKGIPEIFKAHYVSRENAKYGYRPLVQSTFAVEYQLFGRNPYISHLVNLILYAITCMLIYVLLSRLFIGYHMIFPLLITCLFMAHPLHTEVVNNIKCRDELLWFLFGLLSLISLLRYVHLKKQTYLAGALVFMTLGLLSKTTTILLLAVIPLVLFFFTELSVKKIGLLTGLFVVVLGAVALLVKTMVLTEVQRVHPYFENPLYYEDNLFARIPTGFYIVAYYIKMLVLPYPMRYFYGYNQVEIVGWSNPVTILSMLCFVLLLGYLYTKIKKKDTVAFVVIYSLITLFAFSNIIIPVPGIVADRFTYSISLGFCILLAYILLKIVKIPFESKTVLARIPVSFIIIAIIILGGYSISVISRNVDWKDRMTLYKTDMPHLEQSAKAHSLLAQETYRQLMQNPESVQNNLKLNEAKYHFERSLEIYPEYIASLNNLGVLYLVFYHDFQAAFGYFQKALEHNPKNLETILNMGFAYQQIGDLEKALVHYKEALKLDHDNFNIYTQITNIYMTTGQFGNAIKLNKHGLKLFPNSVDLLLNLSNVFSFQGDEAEAFRYLVQAYGASSKSERDFFQLKNYYDGMTRKEDVSDMWNKILNDRKSVGQ